jgi:hypothetical protein
VIVSLQLLRRIYIRDIKLRRYFIENGGAQIIKEFLVSGDVDLIQETLYNIEDLIFVKSILLYNFKNEETEYQTISKLILYEMIDRLLDLQYDKALYELFSEYNLNKQKYFRLADDIRRLITVLGYKEIVKPEVSGKQVDL